eukprot:COSAG03_NODE_19661_length_332_cov_1.304721_1_plen_68_part_10
MGESVRFAATQCTKEACTMSVARANGEGWDDGLPLGGPSPHGGGDDAERGRPAQQPRTKSRQQSAEIR